MKLLLSTLIVLATIPVFSQLSEKDQKKLSNYEKLLENGDIYSSKIKEDKLLEKYPEDISVLDFSIRLEKAKFIDSFDDDHNPIVQATSKPVRGIRYRKIVDRLEKVQNEDSYLENFCQYYYFLIDYQYEAPYDSPPTSFKEIYSQQLSEFKNYCFNQTKLKTSNNYNFSPDSLAVYNYDKGYEAFQQRDFQTAISFYRKSIEMDSNFIEALDNLALTYRHLNELDSAKKYYMISIEKYPQGELAYQNLGVVYQIEEDFQNALFRYHQLSEINPQNPEAYFGMAKAYLAINQNDQAIESGLRCEELYKANNSNYIMDIQYIIGLAHYFKSDQVNAKKYLQGAFDKGFDVPKQLITELKLR